MIIKPTLFGVFIFVFSKIKTSVIPPIVKFALRVWHSYYEQQTKFSSLLLIHIQIRKKKTNFKPTKMACMIH